jgi:prepilin-type N-terminal cleavage/methylation domain-containing protein
MFGCSTEFNQRYVSGKELETESRACWRRCPNGVSVGRDGYSLLELILAMALMVIVMSGIASAINLYMVQLAKQQSRVERELVSRNALTMMANDIRAAVQYKAADYGGLNTLLKTQALMIAEQEGTEEDEIDPTLQEEGDVVLDEEEVSFRPTMLGTSSALMLDISKLPRLDEYNPLMERSAGSESTVSDIKSISYFFSRENGGFDPKVVRRQNQVKGGMYRREIDRAVANYRGDESLQIRPDEFAQLVASEIAEIEFRYFNGDKWQDNWNSEEEGGYPPAIQISLVVDPRRMATGTTSYQYGGYDATMMERHQLTVFLPMGEPAADEEQ